MAYNLSFTGAEIEARLNAVPNKLDQDAALVLGETSAAAYRGDRGAMAYNHSQATGNPHGTTAADVGLGNVDNTADADKPVSDAQQAALDTKQNAITASGILKGNGSTVSAAVSGTDYAPANVASALANRTSAANAANTSYTTLMFRGESLNSAETPPAVNGAIAWTYE